MFNTVFGKNLPQTIFKRSEENSIEEYMYCRSTRRRVYGLVGGTQYQYRWWLGGPQSGFAELFSNDPKIETHKTTRTYDKKCILENANKIRTQVFYINGLARRILFLAIINIRPILVGCENGKRYDVCGTAV